MEIVKMKLKDLKAATYNPRKDLKPSDEEFQHIKNSIQEFGYIEPIIVNKRNNVIVGGHQRSKVLDVLGYNEIDCILVDLDEQQEKAANIALNSAQGVWDFDKLQDLLLEITEFDMKEFGILENSVDWDEIDDITKDNFEEPKKKYIKCPCCGKIDIVEHFMKVNREGVDDESVS